MSAARRFDAAERKLLRDVREVAVSNSRVFPCDRGNGILYLSVERWALLRKVIDKALSSAGGGSRRDTTG